MEWNIFFNAYKKNTPSSWILEAATQKIALFYIYIVYCVCYVYVKTNLWLNNVEKFDVNHIRLHKKKFRAWYEHDKARRRRCSLLLLFVVGIHLSIKNSQVQMLLLLLYYYGDSRFSMVAFFMCVHNSHWIVISDFFFPNISIANIFYVFCMLYAIGCWLPPQHISSKKNLRFLFSNNICTILSIKYTVIMVACANTMH